MKVIVNSIDSRDDQPVAEFDCPLEIIPMKGDEVEFLDANGETKIAIVDHRLFLQDGSFVVIATYNQFPGQGYLL